ncbi:MAG: ATP-binding protein [Nanoarchaeota archaeon]
MNLRFIGREAERRQLQQLQKQNFLLVVKGRRRIGKTTLLCKAFPQASYIFIWPDKSPEWLTQQVGEQLRLPEFKKFSDLLLTLLNQKKMVVLDEFQNFLSIDRSLYGEMQKIVDERKAAGAFLQLAVAGSSHSLINKVFSSAAAPLYGRRTAEITLEHLSPASLFQELKLPLSEFIELWAVFEGVPYYYELLNLNQNARKNIQRLLLRKEALLQEEGKAVLSVEFGSDSKTYNTVLTALAEGKTRLAEIASVFDNRSTEVIKYLNLLRNEYRIVQRQTPLLSDPQKSREGEYQIIDNFLSFWFYFVDKQKQYLEQRRYPEILAFFETNFNSFVGKMFERFILLLWREQAFPLSPHLDKAGRQWGTISSSPPRQNQYEIDLCALNEQSNEILFGECKWQENVDAQKILQELRQKAAYVSWHNQQRKEYYALFAKSFKDQEITDKNVFLYDLAALEKILRKASRSTSL